MDLSGKSAVITGGGNGIGRAIALALADKGVNVAVADIEEAPARDVAGEVAAKGVKSLVMKVDVTDEAQVEALADAAWNAFGSVELVFNNAGVIHGMSRVWESTKDDFDWVFGVNVGGVLNGIRAFAPRFIDSDQQCWIVNTGSEHSFGVPHLTRGLYTATKHAVLGLSDVLRRELPDGVGVSVLCPGIVDTSIWRASERRPENLGGAETADPAAAGAMAMGMAAEEVAQRVIQGIEGGHFYIPTHAHVAEIADERHRGVEDAFTTLAPRYEGDDKYSVEKIIAQLRAR